MRKCGPHKNNLRDASRLHALYLLTPTHIYSANPPGVSTQHKRFQITRALFGEQCETAMISSCGCTRKRKKKEDGNKKGPQRKELDRRRRRLLRRKLDVISKKGEEIMEVVRLRAGGKISAAREEGGKRTKSCRGLIL